MPNHAQNHRILVIDDNVAIHKDFKKILAPSSESSGLDAAEQALFGEVSTVSAPAFDLQFASQGEEGLEAVGDALEKGVPFAVAFVDMRMPPGWDGVQTIEQIWAKDANVQVVICTAYSDYSWEDVRRRLGGDERLLILKKPFDNAEVFQLATSLTEKWNLGTQARLKMSDLESIVSTRTSELRTTNERLAQEIVVRQGAEDQLRHDALHDRLTSLANRTLLTERLTRAMHRSEREPNYLYAVLFLDLDRFKVVNDSLGHLVGDQLLIEVSDRLQKCVRSMDTCGRMGESHLARLGGDEFVILLEGLREAHCIAPIAERILEALSAPVKLGNQQIHISASIGIALGQRDYQRPEDVLRDADTALYRAKASGKSCYQLFDRAMHADAVARLEMERELRDAIANDGLRLYYQPIISVASGKVVSMESLVRWEHPRRGLVMPLSFIPLAEETGLIIPLGDWVLRQACRQCRAWQLRIPAYAGLNIQVNVSGKQLGPGGFAERVQEILAETGLDAKSLILEITESAVLEDTDAVVSQLAKIQKLGVRIDLDDFGTGYSSLSYLQKLPIGGMKIDRSFVSKLGDGPHNKAIVEVMIRAAQTLGICAIAEGVELPQQLDELRSMGCQEVQGFYLSKPMEAGEIEKLNMPAAAA